MALIQLHRSFDLTAPTRFANPEWGTDEAWLDFDGGLRLSFGSPGYDLLDSHANPKRHADLQHVAFRDFVRASFD